MQYLRHIEYKKELKNKYKRLNYFSQGYTILDLEGNIIRKDTINLENKPSYEYERARKTAADKS